ncbi:MAG: sugar ABC transporter permease [Blautia sp.]|nr:sugar ABC transporter permease [Blautia sp.]
MSEARCGDVGAAEVRRVSGRGHGVDIAEVRRAGRKGWRQAFCGIAFLLPDLAGVTCFALLPFCQVVLRSFQNTAGKSWAGIQNYKSVLRNAAFQMAVRNTLCFTLICIPALVVLSLVLAVFLQNLKFCKNVLKSAFLLPMAVPAASVVLVWKVLFHSHGLVNGLLLHLGKAPVAWMTSDAAFWVLVLSYLWKNLGYDMILWMAGLAGISPEIYEAARVDGAGERACFFKITLPNLKASFYTITVLSFLNAFKVFREAWLVAGDYPHQSMYLMQHLYNNWFRELSFDKIAAAAVWNALVVFVLILLLKRAWDTEDKEK